MAGSAADTPAASTRPEFVRVSDADRDEAVDELKREYVDGRLSHETFMWRMQSALRARNQGQLAGLFTDLPERLGMIARFKAAVSRWRQAFPAAGPEDWDRPAIPASRQTPAPWPAQPPSQQASQPPRQRASRQARQQAPPPDPLPLRFPPGTDVSFTIGRDQRCDLHVEHMTVSRLHARLTRDAEGWQLTDLGSTNGTRLNGWRLRTPVPVRPGDLIRFGSAEYIMQPPEAQPPEAQPPEAQPPEAQPPEAGPEAGPGSG